MKSALCLMKQNAQTKNNFFTGDGFSMSVILVAGCFYIIYGKKIPKTGTSFLKRFE